jgi:hypothetical protein
MRELQENAEGVPPFPIRYYTVQPNRWTFQSDKIRQWVESHLHGRVLNACAGKTELTHDGEIVRNDYNPERNADHHYDVVEIADHIEPNTFDCVVFDPPFSAEQADSSYDGVQVAEIGQAMRQFDQLLREGGTVIQMGFTTTCMPGSMDYKRQEVAIFNTLGRMNDWLGTVDKRMSGDLRSYE